MTGIERQWLCSILGQCSVSGWVLAANGEVHVVFNDGTWLLMVMRV